MGRKSRNLPIETTSRFKSWKLEIDHCVQNDRMRFPPMPLYAAAARTRPWDPYLKHAAKFTIERRARAATLYLVSCPVTPVRPSVRASAIRVYVMKSRRRDASCRLPQQQQRVRRMRVYGLPKLPSYNSHVHVITGWVHLRGG